MMFIKKTCIVLCICSYGFELLPSYVISLLIYNCAPTHFLSAIIVKYIAFLILQAKQNNYIGTDLYNCLLKQIRLENKNYAFILYSYNYNYGLL